MPKSSRTPLPHGLPKRLSDGQPGYRRLQKFLEIPNANAVRGVLGAVKESLPRGLGKLQGAEWRREALTAYYGNPKSRRELWTWALAPNYATGLRGQPVPSLEFIALQRYDAGFRDREVDNSAVEEALRDFPNAVATVADAPDWQRPALAAWPALYGDIAEWDDVPDDRREATLLAAFSVATVLDDLRILQWAARCGATLADEFATLLDDELGDSLTGDDDSRTAEEEDVIRQWKETCDAIAAAARGLGEDPLQPELLADLRRQVNTLNELVPPVTETLDRASPEKLLQRARDVVATLAEGADSPIAPWTDRIAAEWQSAYPLPADFEVELLRDDVERLEAELPAALVAWRTARRHRAELASRHEEARQRAEHEDDPLERLDAQDEEAKLQQQLGSAAEEIPRARDRVFRIVAPADQAFDPRRDYQAPRGSTPRRDPTHPLPEPPAESVATQKAAREGPQDGIEPAPATTKPAPAAATGDEDTSPSAPSPEPPPTAEPPTALEQPGLPDPPQQVDRRQASAAEGLWRALGAGRPGIAYHIARLCAERGQTTFPPQLADVIAASMLAPHVHSPDSEAVRDLRPILEGLDPTALLRDERRQTDRDALSLLLFSATFRPSLFAPTTGASALLRAVSLSDDLNPVYDLATRVADHADLLRGVRLHASRLRSSQTGTWQEQFDALKERVRAWHAGADSKRNIYGPATKVWRDLVGHDGLLAKLVRLISDSDQSLRPDVEAIHEQISAQKPFNQLVHRTDQRSGPKRNPIEGRALKQMWNDVQPAVHLSGQWLSLMDTRPDTAGFIARRIEALHNDLERDGGRAVDALAKAVDSASSAAPLAATLTHARNAVNVLLQLFDSDAAFLESSLDTNVLLSRDLLYVTEVDVDASFNPVSTEESRLLDRLLDTSAHADTMRGAFDARLHRDDFVGARFALNSLETEEDVDVDECMASFIQRIDDRRKTLRTDLRNTQKSLERAFCRGQLSADDRDRMATGVAALRQAAEPSSPSSSTPPRLDEMQALTGSSRKLREIDDAIEASSRMSIEMVRGRLRNVPDDQMDEPARAVVERTIEQGYVQTADEQINRLKRGESVESLPPPEDPFSAFTCALEAIESARQATDPQSIVRSARGRERCVSVPFDELAEEDTERAAGLIDTWYQMARKRSVDKARLRSLLDSLGFSVRTVTLQRPGSQAMVTAEPIADRGVCPSRQFGSEANGRYRVLLNWDASAMESIFRSIGIESRDPTIVLHFGCLGAARDEIRKRATREHRLFLVIDETLLLFLAARASKRLSTLFRCTLPYSAAEPYATTSGLVPAELFYGRQRERTTIMDQRGACFIYGGRQLGKTALLRQVEKDFGSNDRVAKWIDLRVNEIDRAPDLWRLIQRDLRPSRVVRGDREIDPDIARQVDSLLRQIREWLDDRDTRRLLLLLDEADHFLLVDAENDFRVSARLKGLMDETDRRFKVVFAGLHNVLRTTRHANHPLAHLVSCPINAFI